MPESAYPSRPQLFRGNTVPLYVRTASSSSSSQDHAHQNGGESQPLSARPDQSFGLGQRKQPSSTFSGSVQSSRMAQGFNLPPTPPLSTSPGSAESSNTEDAYFPAVPGARLQSPYASNSVRSAKSSGAYTSSPLSPVTSPTVTSHPTSFQTLRSTRAQNKSAPMKIEQNSMAYTLSAVIGPGFDSSCITIAMRKNNILDIVADRWDQEKDCHHEWQIQFDRDADMNGVHAGYADGVLTVTVKRLNQSSSRPPQMRP